MNSKHTTNHMLKSINPATGKVLTTVKEWNIEKINKQVSKSKKAFEHWKETDFSDRSNLLKKTAQVLRNKKERYACVITKEMGKPIAQAEAEVEKCAWVCDYYAENGASFLENEYVKTDAGISYMRFSPLGVVLAIMPWNFPFWQVFRCAAPALMAGNTILLKHASNVPQCAIAIEEIFREAGFPDDVFRSILVSSKFVDKIIENPNISTVTFTGSSIAGRNVAAKAGSCLKKTVLELGGSDPFVILSDADLEQVIEQAVKARMINNGQSCIAAKRFIIEGDVFDEFKKDFSEKVEQLVVDDPMDRSTDIGPLARSDILEQLHMQIQKSIQKGAIVDTGGKKLEEKPGCYYLPTVISNVRKRMPVYDEETFGPVAPLIKVRDEKEAITVANDTSYGLGASIWTADSDKGEILAQQIQAGAIFVNGIVKSDPRLPFGGIKESGYGRELSSYGIKEFVNIQTVWIK